MSRIGVVYSHYGYVVVRADVDMWRSWSMGALEGIRRGQYRPVLAHIYRFGVYAIRYVRFTSDFYRPLTILNPKLRIFFLL